MKNTLADKREALFAQAEDMADGLDRYAAILGVAWITPPVLRDALGEATTPTRGFDEARAARQVAVAVQTEADEAGRKFIRTARNVLALRLGELYSDAWAPTGFPNQSTSVPKTIAERQELLRSLQQFYAAHPAEETPALNLTALQADALFNQLSDARSAVNNRYEQLNATLDERNAALDTLRGNMRWCIQELGHVLAEDDPRWYSFGLNPPAAPATPEVVEGLALNSMGAGAGVVLASWDHAPRAERYRVFKQVVGVDAELVPVETVHDTQFAFTGLTPGQTLRVQIVAANEAGSANPSEVSTIVVG